MSVRIITESICDVDLETAEKWKLELLPVRIRIGEEDYTDGVDLSASAFYEKMVEVDELPKTSQITPYQYSQAIQEAVSAGDDALVITISQKLSGCWRNACLSAEEYEGHVRVVDSGTASIGQYILCQEACRLRDEGKSLNEIADLLEEEKKNIHVIALMETLDYLSKGGRISKTAALAGKMLGIKPVIEIRSGEVRVLGKARGSKSGANMLIREILNSGGIDFDKPLVSAYTGLSDVKLRKYIHDSAPLYAGHFTEEELPSAIIGSAVGVYAGPGAIGFAYFAKNRKSAE
jgi:DegV family protein with EDD domain